MNKQRTLGKRALSYILCMALVLSGLMVPTQQVRAEETPEVEIGAIVASGDCGATANDDVTWVLTKNGEVDGNDTYTLTIKGNGAMADYIPDDNDPEWVTNYRNNITKIVIGYGITRIGNDSFYDCSKVEEVVFERNENGESSVTAIGDYAFNSDEKLTSIVIPASVETIGNFAFRLCIKLTSVTFEEGSSLTSIGAECLFSTIKLEQLVIPSKVKSLGNYSVGICDSLKYVYYPSIVNNFGTQVFYSTDSLEYFGRYTINETAKTCSVQYIGLDTTTWLPDDNIVPTASEIIIPEKLDGYEVVQVKVGSSTVAVPTSFEAEHKIAKLSDIEALEGWTYEAETDELPLGGSVDVTATYNVSETQKLTKKITVSRAACVDANKDHKCDLGCDAVMGDCIDTNKDHKCDYGCDKVTEHTWDAGVITKEPTPQDKG
ncbi:MAG: leucine-rich repeat domain-containing protein, partial [Lachnospiraceae bacterium]|nr:leucine-rich repeat domain-containing protein [Lachnospiraceae bacterium]